MYLDEVDSMISRFGVPRTVPIPPENASDRCRAKGEQRNVLTTLKAQAKNWPRLSQMCRIFSDASHDIALRRPAHGPPRQIFSCFEVEEGV